VENTARQLLDIHRQRQAATGVDRRTTLGGRAMFASQRVTASRMLSATRNGTAAERAAAAFAGARPASPPPSPSPGDDEAWSPASPTADPPGVRTLGGGRVRSVQLPGYTAMRGAAAIDAGAPGALAHTPARARAAPVPGGGARSPAAGRSAFFAGSPHPDQPGDGGEPDADVGTGCATPDRSVGDEPDDSAVGAASSVGGASHDGRPVSRGGSNRRGGARGGHSAAPTSPPVPFAASGRSIVGSGRTSRGQSSIAGSDLADAIAVARLASSPRAGTGAATPHAVRPSAQSSEDQSGMFARVDDAEAAAALAEAHDKQGLGQGGGGGGRPADPGGAHDFAWDDHGPGGGADGVVGPCDCEVTGRNLCLVPRGSWLQRCAAKSVLRSDPFSGEQFEPLCRCWAVGRRLWVYPDNIIVLLIVLDSIIVAVDGLNAQFSEATRDALFATEAAVTVVFVLEILLSLVAQGALLHPGAMWRSGWALLDTVVVATSAVAVALPLASGSNQAATGLGWAAALRSIRALRPLRVIARNRGIKVVINALLSSLPALGSTVMVLVFGVLLFAIAGVQLFAGQFSECNDPAFPPGAPLAGLRGPGGSWASQPCAAPFSFVDHDTGETTARMVVRSPEAPLAFDHLGEALLTVFVAASGEGWPGTMWRAQDIAGPGLQPVRRLTPSLAMYWVALIVVLEWFLTQLFIGAVFEEFIKLKRREETGVAALTARQKQFLAGQRFLGALLPVRLFEDPEVPCRRVSRAVADSSAFRVFVRIVIAVNVGAQVAAVPTAPAAYTNALEAVNAACAAIFIAEAAVELAGRGVRQVLASPWSVFDLAVAAGAAVELVLLAAVSATPAWVRVPLQLLRVSRAIRLAREIPGVRAMILAIWGVRATILSIGGLLVLLLAVAAAVAMNLFGGPAFTAALGPHGNFADFPAALLTLMRIVTGEGWESIMTTILGAGADPATGEAPGAFARAAAIPFFVLFVVLFSFLFVALFLILVVEAYSEMDDQRRSSLKADVDTLRASWAVADPHGTKWILFWRLEGILRSLPAPFGVGRDARHPEILHFVRRLRIRAYNGHVYFRELLLALHRNSYGVGMPSRVLDNLETAPHAVRKRLRTKLLHRLVSLSAAAHAAASKQGHGGSSAGVLAARARGSGPGRAPSALTRRIQARSDRGGVPAAAASTPRPASGAAKERSPKAPRAARAGVPSSRWAGWQPAKQSQGGGRGSRPVCCGRSSCTAWVAAALECAPWARPCAAACARSVCGRAQGCCPCCGGCADAVREHIASPRGMPPMLTGPREGPVDGVPALDGGDEAAALDAVMSGTARAAMLRLLAVLPADGVRVYEVFGTRAAAAVVTSRPEAGHAAALKSHPSWRRGPKIVTRSLGDLRHSSIALRLGSERTTARGAAQSIGDMSPLEAKRIDVEQLLARADRPAMVECEAALLLVAQRLRQLVHSFVLRRRERHAASGDAP